MVLKVRDNQNIDCHIIFIIDVWFYDLRKLKKLGQDNIPPLFNVFIYGKLCKSLHPHHPHKSRQYL